MVQPKPKGPVVVEGLEAYADQNFYAAYEMLTDETIGGTMTRMSRTTAIGALSTDSIVGVDVRHPKENDEKHAVLVGYPFANDHQLHMQLRLDMTQRSLEEPLRFIGLPNNTYNSQAFLLDDDDEKARVSEGDFGPIANLIGSMISKQGIERVDLAGYSKGASVLAALLEENEKHGYFGIRSAMLGDAPNVVNRTELELIKDFSCGGTKPFEKAVRDSGLDTLEEAQGIKHLYQKPRQIMAFGKFGLSALGSINRAIISGMSQNTFTYSLLGAADGQKGLFAHAENSLVCPAHAVDPAEYPESFDIFEIPGYGHEAADNIATHALLVKKAIEGQAT